MLDRRERNNLAAATFILSGLVLEKAIVQPILREEIVKESVTYQDILQHECDRSRSTNWNHEGLPY